MLRPTAFVGLSLSICALLSAACGESTGDDGGGGGAGGGAEGGGGAAPVEGVDFACGSETCNSAESYCYFTEDAPDDQGNQFSSRGCVALPEACLAEPTCECIAEIVGPFECCSGDAATGVLAQNPHGGCL